MADPDLILHPIRMRIVLELAHGQRTVQQLVDAFPDVPQATLYRHINTLAAGGVIVVVEERRVRSNREKVYALQQDAARLSGAAVQHASNDDHRRYFTAFMTSLLHDFARYLDRTAQVDLDADGVTYSKAAIYLTDEELADLKEQVRALLTPLLTHEPLPGRRRRIVANIILLDAEEQSERRS